MNHTVGSYQKVQVETTDALKLVVMLYEGAINFLEQAKLRLANNQVADKGILINKVMAIISELQGSLNMDSGGEVSVRLDGLYTYMINRLFDANLNNDPEILSEVIKHLRSLKDAWKTISDNGKKGIQTQPAAMNQPRVVESTSPPEHSPEKTAPIEVIG
jgi:flagellar protein FliS